MFSVNTDTSILPLSTFVNSVTSSYVNDGRGVNTLYSVSSISGVDFNLFNFSDSIKNVIVDKEYTLMLSNYSQLSSFISTHYDLNSYVYGRNSDQFVCNYSTISSNFIQENSENINNQYVVIIDNNINILPLKTFDDLGRGRYNTFKTYQKLYKKNKPFIQYKITSLPKVISPDTTNIIYNSYGVESLAVSASSFINQGAIGGSCPLNSDMILFNSGEYEIHSDIGVDNVHNIHNGTLLGLWLSAQTYEVGSNKIWMERWFDPNTSSINFSPYLHSLSADLSYLVDIPTNKILSPKEKIEYVRHGPNRNDSYIDTIEGAVLNLTSWNSSFSQPGLSGYLTAFDGESSYFNMNGSSYGTVLPSESILIKNELTFATWLDTSFEQDSQIFGNFYNGYGYGMSINLGDSLDSTTIPSVSSNCFSINYRGFKIFEKDVLGDLGLSAINIKYINTDLNGNAWLYDDFNKKIYRLENDDMISYQVTLPEDASITKIKSFSNDSFAVFNTNGNIISSFNSIGTLLSSVAVGPFDTTFDINSNDVVTSAPAEFLLFDNFDREIKIVGASIYIDDIKILHLLDKPSSMVVDIENNIWLLVGKNLLKIDVFGNIILDIILSLDFTTYTSTEMAFITNNMDGFNLWIIFNDASRIIVLDDTGYIVKRIPLNNIGNRICSNYSFDIHGSFSNFDNIRKFNKLDGLVISKTNPAITLKIALRCGSAVSTHMIHAKTPTKKWNHIAFTLGYSNNTTIIKIYINGIIAAEKILNGIHTVQYNTPSSPFIIGDYAGKLGPRNLEKSISMNNFLIGKLSHLNIYNKCLSDFDIQSLARQAHTKWDGIFINMDIPPMTIIEDVEKVNINRYKGYKTNKFNVVIKNFSADTVIQDYIKNYILDNIKNIIPVNTSLNSIIFE